MGLRPIIGQPARGENFFKREDMVRQLWKRIDSGSSILLSAPRRVGKTSLMFYLLDNPKEDYIIKYVVVESVNNENEYYKRLYEVLYEAVSGRDKAINTITSKIGDFMSRVKKVGASGIELSDNSILSYKDSFKRLVQSMDNESKKVIIMVDEFAQAVENIKVKNTQDAEHFLQSNREFRINPEISEKLQFIYTGSIGLENVVSSMKCLNLINDLNTFHVKPLTVPEAEKLIAELLEYHEFELLEGQISYILDKIRWLIPFYIQLIIQEIGDKAITNTMIDIPSIDDAFKSILEQRNHFEHWNTRLKKAFKASQYKFAAAVLNAVAKDESISSNEIFDLAVKYGMEDEFKDTVRTLVYDGYMNNNDDAQYYRFNSPILRMWWWKNVAN